MKYAASVACRIRTHQRQVVLPALPDDVLGRSDELPEERMGSVGTRTEFRVELCPNHEWVICKFHYLDEVAIGGQTGGPQSYGFELLSEYVVELPTVSVALMDYILSVGFGRPGVLDQLTGIQTQPHTAAHLIDVLL